MRSLSPVQCFQASGFICGKVTLTPNAGRKVSHNGLTIWLETTREGESSSKEVVLKHVWTLAEAGQLTGKAELAFEIDIATLPEFPLAAVSVLHHTLGIVLQRSGRRSPPIQKEEPIVIHRTISSCQPLPPSLSEAMASETADQIPDVTETPTFGQTMDTEGSFASNCSEGIFARNCSAGYASSDSEEEDQPEVLLHSLAELTAERNTAVAFVLSPFLTGRRVLYETGAVASEAEVVRVREVDASSTRNLSSPKRICAPQNIVCTVRLSDGSLVHASPCDVSNVSPGAAAEEEEEVTSTYAPAPTPEACLTALTMQPLSAAERKILGFRLRAATFVVAGAWCTKLTLSPSVAVRQRRFLKLLSSSGTVTWGSRHQVHSPPYLPMPLLLCSPCVYSLGFCLSHLAPAQGKVLRADSSCAQHVLLKHNLSDAERECSLQLVLQHRTLLLLAPTVEERNLWVDGCNALLSGLYY